MMFLLIINICITETINVLQKSKILIKLSYLYYKNQKSNDKCRIYITDNINVLQKTKNLNKTSRIYITNNINVLQKRDDKKNG